MKSGIYIASKAKHGARWKLLRDQYNVPITSSWIDEYAEGQTSDYQALWQRCIAEAAAAAVLFVYAEPGEQLKGALVEMGAALAAGVAVCWYGPPVGGTCVRHPAVQVLDTRLAFEDIVLRSVRYA